MTGLTRNLVRLVAVLALTVGLAEGGIRVLDPTPRVQIVALDGADGRMGEVRVVAGVPLWRAASDEVRTNLDCAVQHPERERWLVLGSSILAGSGLPPQQDFSVRLQEQLLAQGVPVCVVNLAEGAYTYQNEAALAEETVRTLKPRLVLLELWQNSPFDWTLVGSRAFRFDALGVPPGDVPGPAAFPAGLRRALFGHSRLWEFSSLALARPDDGAVDAAWARLTQERLPALERLVRSEGGRLVLLPAPALDRPLSESLALRASHDVRSSLAVYDPVLAWAKGAGVEVVDLAELLADVPVEEIRRDTCCHYNERGHQLLADRIAAWRLSRP